MLGKTMGLVILASPGSSWWTAPPQCPTPDEVAALIESESDQPIAEALEIRAVVTQEDGRWQLMVDVGSGQDVVHRELDFDSCAAAAEATALIYGVAASDAAEAAEATPEPGPSPEPVPKPPVDDAADVLPEPDSQPVNTARPPPPPATPREPNRGLRGLVMAGGGVGVGGFTSLGGHIEAGLGLDVWRLRTSVFGSHDFARSFSIAEVGARISASTASVRVGVPLPFAERFEAEPALFIRGGGLRAEGSGGRTASTHWVPWATVGAAAALSVDLINNLGLRLDTAVEFSTLRHTFTFDDLLVRNTGLVGARITLGLQLRFSTGPR